MSRWLRSLGLLRTIAAASDRCGSVYFEPGDLFGGVASHAQGPAMVEVAAVTVDSLVRDRRRPPPYLLKLDTHGFEVPILEGAGESLKRTQTLQVVDCSPEGWIRKEMK